MTIISVDCVERIPLKWWERALLRVALLSTKAGLVSPFWVPKELTRPSYYMIDDNIMVIHPALLPEMEHVQQEDSTRSGIV